MRPRKIKTLKDLKDFITQAEASGATDATYLYDGDIAEITAVFYTEPPVFICFEYWTNEDLQKNAAHNDQRGTPPHFSS